MQKPEAFFEIELKALLTRKQHERLFEDLPKKMKLINEETIHTTRYRPGDIRLRHSIKTLEIVCKSGDPTKICRKEVKIPLASKEKLEHFALALDLLEFKPDPPWIKHKQEFEFAFNGFDYVVCLQHIENFAYILEVEFLSKTDDSHIHEPNLIAIIKELGLKPINPLKFTETINNYIKANQVKQFKQ